VSACSLWYFGHLPTDRHVDRVLPHSPPNHLNFVHSHHSSFSAMSQCPMCFLCFFCVLYNNVSNRLWQWVASIWWVYTLLATLLYYCFSLSPSSSEKHTRAPPLDITVSQGIWSWAAEFASFHGSLPNLLPDDDCIIFKVESKFATLSEKKTGNLLKSTNCFSNQQNYTTM